MEYLYSNYPVIFSNAFFGASIFFIICELLVPSRVYSQGAPARWLNNVILGGLNMYLARFLAPMSGFTLAIYAEKEQLGLFNYWALPVYIQVIISFLVIDLSGYIFHRISHTSSLLWRFHLVHHSDKNVDVSTSVRHHPVELFITVIFNALVIVSLGAPLIAVIFYEIFRVVVSAFSHANIQIPASIERFLRLLIVTPNFHCIHHAASKIDTNSNYSNTLSCWDYFFATYNNKKPEQIIMGLEYFRSDRDTFIDRLITQPIRFKNSK